MTDNAASQMSVNRAAREIALAAVSPAVNLAAPTVSYQADGPVLLLGPEHRLRLALARLAHRLPVTALVTEAMPEQLTPAMERAAALAHDVELQRLPLESITGYLGAYRVAVGVAGESVSLAKLGHGVETFAAVLDLGDIAQLAMILKPAGYLCAGDEDLDAQVDALLSMRGAFEKPRYVQVNTELCAHSRAEQIGCTRCLDLCPADAIRSHAFQIEVDAHLCHGAGGCATACPTGAIRYGYPQPQQTLSACRNLLDRYREAGGQSPRILIHDAEWGRQWYSEHLAQLDPSWLGLQVEELGAAGLDLWLSALAWGAAEVALLAPPELPETIIGSLDAELETAKRLLAGLQHELAVRWLGEGDLLGVVQLRTNLLPAQQLAAGGAKRGQIMAASAALYEQAHLPAALDSRISLAKGAPFGNLALQSGRCTLCMACVSVCPVQALSSGRDLPELAFNEEACVQCGLCTGACPESALQLNPSFELNPVRREQRRVLKAEEPFSCIHCGEPFATQGAINVMLERLAGHSMFTGSAVERLRMCGDCRVVDLVASDPGGDLFEFAKGRRADSSEINLAQEVKR